MTPHFYGLVVPDHPAACVRIHCVPRDPPLFGNGSTSSVNWASSRLLSDGTKVGVIGLPSR